MYNFWISCYKFSYIFNIQWNQQNHTELIFSWHIVPSRNESKVFTEHVRRVFWPLLQKHANQPQGQGFKVWTETASQTGHDNCRRTSALCASHKAVPSEPLKSLGTAQSQGQPPQHKCWLDTAQGKATALLLSEVCIFTRNEWESTCVYSCPFHCLISFYIPQRYT